MGRLDGKVAVITGANSGIGLACAKRFAQEGARVFMTGRREAELDAAVAEVGSGARGVPGDIANLADLARLYEIVLRPRLDPRPRAPAHPGERARPGGHVDPRAAWPGGKRGAGPAVRGGDGSRDPARSHGAAGRDRRRRAVPRVGREQLRQRQRALCGRRLGTGLATKMRPLAIDRNAHLPLSASRSVKSRCNLKPVRLLLRPKLRFLMLVSVSHIFSGFSTKEAL